MKTFFNSISLINQNSKQGKENKENNIIDNSNISMDNEVDNILLDSKKEEDIIFYHYGKNNLMKLNYEEKSVASFSFLEYDINSDDDDKLVLDEKEIENIKTYHVLHVLKPKIELYFSYKNIEFNCNFLSNLYSYAEEIGFEYTIGYLLPIIQDLADKKNKKPNLLIAFLDGFEKLVIYFKQFDKENSIILQKIFPIISKILTTRKETNILNKAVNALKFLIDNITIEECLDNIIPLLIQMANDEENEIGQMISIQIFSDKASILGGNNIEVYILPMFQCFSENIKEKIRLYCIQYMIPLFENINYNIIQTKFIKIYHNFSKDKSYLIRKLSCNLLPSVCKTIMNNNNNYNPEESIKKEELISKNILEIFYSFTKDDMKNNALSIFGEFIPYLNEETIIKNENLLNFYIEQLKKTFKNKYIDSKTIFDACYSFPSVLLSYYSKIKDDQIKNKNWILLKPLYLEFIKSKEFRIKNSISAAFGVISSILDEKIFENEICPLIKEMYFNNNIKIKNSIIIVIPKFLLHIKDIKLRLEFLSIYKKGFDNIKNYKTWRNRINYAKGIKKMIELFDIDIIFKDLVKMLIEMCFDVFNVIRIKAAKTLSIFLLKFLLLENNDNYKQNAINILINFGRCKHYHYRQLFVYLCKKIITNEKIFKEYAYDLFNDLSYDKVINTRYTLSKFLSYIWNKNKKEYEWIKNDEKIIEIIFRLKNDKEIDVKKCVENIDINSDKIDKEKVLEKINVNDKFINEFKDFKNIFDYEPFLGKAWLNNEKNEIK